MRAQIKGLVASGEDLDCFGFGALAVSILTSMRVARTACIAAIPAPLARELMRAYWQERPTADIRYWVPTDPRPESEITQSLAHLELLELRFHSGGEAWWRTTIAGNAPAHASFRRPIKRATAERHLTAVIERAHGSTPTLSTSLTSCNSRCSAAT